uniref:histidine kinase n=1 Tax=Cicer arietinum TaxID=3827 RepID=A0A3Q7XP89_CICAR|nr:histidine kinase CKI1-like [Cicer arietinum]
MALQSLSFVTLLAYGSLITLVALTPCWYVMVTHMEKRANLNSQNIVSHLQSEIEYSADLLHPMKSSSTNLARLLNSPLDSSTNISFSDIKTKIAPLLFQAFVTVPHLTQISYIGMEGFFFSYSSDHNQTLAMYSNSSSMSSNGIASNKTLYYIQPVNNETGEVFGEAIISNSSINTSWIKRAANLSDGFVSLGTKWNNGSDILFLSYARVTKVGVISLGLSAKAITDFVTRVDRLGTSSYLATKDGKILVEGIQHINLIISNDSVNLQSVNANGDFIKNEGTVSCKDEAIATSLNIQDIKYLIQCYPIDIMGIESVYVLAVPRNGFDVSYKKKGLALLNVMMVMILVAVFAFLFIDSRAIRREMHLCASLIKQKEATHQAEKKNMNKSLAVASASHDVRASLAGIIALIKLSSKLVVPGSELSSNLIQMEDCTQDFLGLLNSILDTSKIEVGKMLLNEEEFDLSHLLEEVVDIYHLVSMEKGVDLILDPCNGSIIKYSQVKGDKQRLKQVLCNLLSNAVKFTKEGHITVRVWAQKPTLSNSIIKTNQHSITKHLSCLFSKKNEPEEDLEKTMNSVKQELHSMDFVFEVDDTGKGIPKENYKSVFENYVQVKETDPVQEGTGLGLGIVQSLVRLMHGDIGIVNKNIGEKGTCFRFNVLLSICEGETVTDFSTREALECGPSNRNQAQGRTFHPITSGSSICSMSPMLNICSSSPRLEASRVVLFIRNEERRRTCHRFMKSLGIKVKVVNSQEDLFDTLEEIKQKGRRSGGPSSPESSNLSSYSASHNSFARARGVPLSAMDGTEYISSVFKKTNTGAVPGFILIVIDTNAGPSFPQLCEIVSTFKKGLHNRCNVVWLDNPHIHRIDSKAIDQNDIVISKPFHGSRLFQVIMLLPEYGNVWQQNIKRETTHDRSSLSKHRLSDRSDSEVFSFDGSPCLSVWKGIQKSCIRKSPVHQGEIYEIGDSSSSKPLHCKKFLVVDDTKTLRMLATSILVSLGATVEQCENGEEAVRLVHEGLSRDLPNLPYDYILMDCQMPVMNGFEATRRIREMEKSYGVCMPIIALTADIDSSTAVTGMDFHIEKPLRKEHLLEAIRYLNRSDIM